MNEKTKNLSQTERDDPGSEEHSQSKAPFAYPAYRNFWIGFLVSSFGSQIQAVGAAWMMTALTSSTIMIALVQASVTFPMMLMALLAGAMADSYNRRKIILLSQYYMLIISVILFGLAYADMLSAEVLLLLTFLLGAGVAINAPSQGASVGDMLPRAAMPAGVALNSMGFNIARSAGPALGGVIVALAGATWAFGFNVSTYLVFIAIILFWRPQYPSSSLPREPLGKAMLAGLRYVGMSPPLLAVMGRVGYFGLLASAAPALLPLIARDLVGGGPGAFGLLSASFGVGATAGALLVARYRAHFSSENLMRISALALAAGTALAGASTSLWLTALSMILLGIGWMGGLSNCNILVQMSAPRWVVGRSLALYQTCAFGAMAVGAAIVGWMAAEWGLQVALFLVAALQLGNIVLGFVLRLHDMAGLDIDPLAPTFAPETQVQIDPRSGPVIITLEYRIGENDTGTFLSLMQERRRVMRRDGARAWRLLQDVDDGDRWVERYQVATWHDYIRQITRRTQDDRAIWDRIMTLHRGSERPTATRMIERPTGGAQNSSMDTITVPLRL